MLTKETVLRIAKLARLRLSDDEAAVFGLQLSAVLDNFNEISGVDTKNIEPLVTPSEIALHFRADQAEASASTDEILANAPEKSGHLFKVPPVV